MKFLEKYRKEASKIDGVDIDLVDPEFYLTSGNFVINRLLFGSYSKCFPQGRLSAIAGPSSTGKTFVASNCAKFALDNGYGVFYIDTENAIDKGHFKAIGIDHDHPMLQYTAVSTISQTVEVVSTFIKLYRAAGETIPFLIVIDSLDMLETDTDVENYEKGEQKGGMGQKQLQLKKMLNAFVHDIKKVPMHMICTKQVYVNQNTYTNKQEPWIFTESLKFAFSQILLVTKLMLKGKENYVGFKLKAFGYKTRFTKPFQQCDIDVPYDTGMDPYTGLLSAAVSLGIVKREPKQSWCYYGEEKFQGEAGFKKYREQILADLIKIEDQDINVVIDAEEDESEAKEETPMQKIKKKFKKANESDQESA